MVIRNSLRVNVNIMKLKSVNFSASNAKCSVKFASVNENLSHAAFDNNDCLFTF